jgi:hypothetical protein
MKEDEYFPPMPLDKWEGTYNTLHLYLQIIGKIRLALFPPKNHWWHVALYVSSRGLTTLPIPYRAFNFTIEFDFIDHSLVITTSKGQTERIRLQNLTVAEFYRGVVSRLSDLGIDAPIKAVPYDVPDVSTEPFEKDTTHASYDGEYVRRFWSVLVGVDSIFGEFRGHFLGKSTPVHLFWHHMDLALTFFSGKKAPEREGAGLVERDASSHEVISFGFWAGDKNVREPAFYAYASPPPEGLMDEPLKPEGAFWNREAGMALLMYNRVREEKSPQRAVLDFLDSVYRAGAERAGWDTDALNYRSG